MQNSIPEKKIFMPDRLMIAITIITMAQNNSKTECFTLFLDMTSKVLCRFGSWTELFCSECCQKKDIKEKKYTNTNYMSKLE